MCQLPFIFMCVRSTRSPENCISTCLPTDDTRLDQTPGDWMVFVDASERGQHGFEPDDWLAGERAIEGTRRAEDGVALRHAVASGSPSRMD